MKKLRYILIAFLLLVFAATQIKAQSAITDTLQGAETVNFTSMSGAKMLTATCTQLGGTSDGTLALYGSPDGYAWSFINGVGAMILTASPQASITGSDLNQITITNSLVASWVLHEKAYRFYRLTGVGTSGDTTKVVINWRKW